MSLATFRLSSLPEFDLPSLPDVDEGLLTMALTHASANASRRRGIDLAHDKLIPDKDYRKLALVGDSLVDAIVAQLLHELYPSMTIGTTTKLRSLLVDNFMLSDLCKRYGLHERMVTSADARATIIRQVSARASGFEAVVAAVYYGSLSAFLGKNSAEAMGEGMTRLKDWLYPLFTPIARYALEKMAAAHVDGPAERSSTITDEPSYDEVRGATSVLNTWVSKQRGAADVLYNQLREGDLWRIECTLIYGGKLYEDSAVRRNTQEAKTVAAWKVAMLRGGIL